MQSNIFKHSGGNKKLVLIPFIIYLLIYSLLFFLNTTPIFSYAIIYLVTSFVFIFLCIYVFRTDLSKPQILFLLICGIILRVAVLFIEPIGSEDYTRYVWDGKVLADGINPYKYAPADEELSHLHSADLPERVKFPEVKTVYPPLSLILFYLGYLIGGETFWGIKLLLFIFEMLTFLGLFSILKEIKLPEKNILIYVLAPLPVFHLFIDAHVDGFGLTFIVFSILFYLKKKKMLSFIFIGLSICIKPLGLILFPIIFLIEEGIKAKLKTVIVPLVICIIIYLPFAFSVNVFEALITFTVNWTFNGFAFEILNSFLSDNQKSRLICGILFLLVYLVVIFSKKDFLAKVYLSVFLLFIFSPIVHPWYVSWLAVLLPFIPRWSGILYTALISLTVFTIYNYQLYGVWKNYPLVLIFEYTPVLIIFFYELYKTSFIRTEVISNS
ncbi:MAG TPA: hypothetical protein VLN45_03970 [Ignavibacteriaceae bacterium]|nr:hypothetical protein [Ignavibacteriaceae bacterium]